MTNFTIRIDLRHQSRQQLKTEAERYRAGEMRSHGRVPKRGLHFCDLMARGANQSGAGAPLPILNLARTTRSASSPRGIFCEHCLRLLGHAYPRHHQNGFIDCIRRSVDLAPNWFDSMDVRSTTTETALRRLTSWSQSGRDTVHGAHANDTRAGLHDTIVYAE